MPCEILVKAETYTHPDPRIDASGVYKIGDLVLGFDYKEGIPVEWGSEEGPPKFAIWHIPDMKLKDFEKWCLDTYGCRPFESEYETESIQREGEALPPEVILRRRIYVDKDSLPPIGVELFSTGRAALPPHTDYIKLKPSPKF